MISIRGFTLLELSIVMVIIGLVIGGILVGRDLIKSAEERAQIKQLQEIQTAVNMFKLKYNCLPGDCASASDFGFTGSGYAAYNGNGDGSFPYLTASFVGGDSGPGGTWVNPASNATTGNYIYESANFWYHLSRAGLIKDAITPCCASSTSPTFVFSFLRAAIGSDSTRIFLGEKCCWEGALTAFTAKGRFFHIANYSNNTYSGVLTPAESLRMDTKFDDGMPGSGRMLFADFGDRRYIAARVVAEAPCTTGNPARYDTANTGQHCAPVFRTDF